MLDLLQPADDQWTAVPVPQKPPRLRQQLRIRGVPSVDLDDDQLAIAVLRVEHQWSLGTVPHRSQTSDVDTNRVERFMDVIERRRARRRTEQQMDERGNGEPDAEATERLRRVAELERQRSDDGRDHGDVAEPANRLDEVR